MPEKTVSVPAIHCGHCVRTIERELAEVEGVVSVRADATTKQVTVAWEAPADWARLAGVLDEIGFPPAGG
jgi:copper chaperone CopZ